MVLYAVSLMRSICRIFNNNGLRITITSGEVQGNYSFPQKLSSVEFVVTFSQFLLNLDCESICDPPGGDTLLAQGIYLTDSLH